MASPTGVFAVCAMPMVRMMDSVLAPLSCTLSSSASSCSSVICTTARSVRHCWAYGRKYAVRRRVAKSVYGKVQAQDVRMHACASMPGCGARHLAHLPCQKQMHLRLQPWIPAAVLASWALCRNLTVAPDVSSWLSASYSHSGSIAGGSRTPAAARPPHTVTPSHRLAGTPWCNKTLRSRGKRCRNQRPQRATPHTV